MGRRIDLNEMLENAARQRDYGDGSAERVWSETAREKKRTRFTLGGAIPLLAACAAIAALFAIPQARAGLFGLIGSAMDLVSRGGRPAATAPTLLPAVHCTQEAVDVQPGGEWVYGLQTDVKAAEYDGQYLDLTLELSSSAGNFIEHEEPGQGETVLAREVNQGRLIVNARVNGKMLEEMTGNKPVRKSAGRYEVSLRYDAESCESLEGVAQATLDLQCWNMSYGGDGNAEGSMVGMLELRFQIDLTPGNAAAKRLDPANEKHPLTGRAVLTSTTWDKANGRGTYVNVDTPLEGCSLEVVKILRKPQETFLRIRFAQAKGFDPSLADSLLVGLSVKLNADGTPVEGAVSWDDNGYETFWTISAKGVPENAKRLTIRLYYSYMAAIGGAALEVEKPVELNGDETEEFLPSGPVALPGGTFTVALP